MVAGTLDGSFLRAIEIITCPLARRSDSFVTDSATHEGLSASWSRRQTTPARVRALVVAYHSACSLQHGQKVGRMPKELLSKIGFVVKDVPEGHLCCGSAGIYNILQPHLARRLRDRKIGNIEKVRPDVIAAGNIGCMTQIAAGTAIPVVHTVELVDWATGGPAPEGLAGAGVSAATSETVVAAM